MSPCTAEEQDRSTDQHLNSIAPQEDRFQQPPPVSQSMTLEGTPDTVSDLHFLYSVSCGPLPLRCSLTLPMGVKAALPPLNVLGMNNTAASSIS